MEIVYAIAIILGGVSAILIGLSAFFASISMCAIAIGATWDDKTETFHTPEVSLTNRCEVAVSTTEVVEF